MKAKQIPAAEFANAWAAATSLADFCAKTGYTAGSAKHRKGNLSRSGFTFKDFPDYATKLPRRPD